MKPKNMILLAIACGCGLVAAVLSTQLSAGGGKVDMIEVLAAKKELPVGTLLEEKDFNETLTRVSLPRTAVSPDVITDQEALKGKRTGRTMRQGNYFSPQDVSTSAGIALPEGKLMYAMRTDVVGASGGFAIQGSRVNVLASRKDKRDGDKIFGYTLMKNMLIVAVDTADRRPEGGGAAIPTIQSVSIAVTQKESEVMKAAGEMGGTLTLALIGVNNDAAPSGLTEEALEMFGPKKKEEEAKVSDDKPIIVADTVDIVFAKADIELNTLVGDKNVADLFEMKSFLKNALPESVITNLSEIKGRYITSPVMKGQLVLDRQVGKEAVAVEVKEEGPTIAPIPGAPKPFVHEVIIQSGNRIRRQQYQGKTPGDLREVERADTNGIPLGEPIPEADATKKPEAEPMKKPESDPKKATPTQKITLRN